MSCRHKMNRKFRLCASMARKAEKVKLSELQRAAKIILEKPVKVKKKLQVKIKKKLV